MKNVIVVSCKVACMKGIFWEKNVCLSAYTVLKRAYKHTKVIIISDYFSILIINLCFKHKIILSKRHIFAARSKCKNIQDPKILGPWSPCDFVCLENGGDIFEHSLILLFMVLLLYISSA